MKKHYFLTLLITLCVSTLSFGQVILAEGFSYADGSLVPNGGWAREGGTAGDFQVSSGQAVVQHGTPSEDVKLAFTSVAGDIYAGFDFSVDDLGAPFSGTDFEYFTHLDFRARMDVQAPTGGGDYTVGISSSSSTAEATWGADLTFGTVYRAIIKFDQVTGTATLWIDPAVSTDTSIVGSDAGAFSISEFELRQSDSSENETVRVDDLMIGQTFNDVLVFAPPTNPALSITGVTDGQVFSPETTEVVAAFSIQNFTLSGDNGSGMSDGTGDGYVTTVLQETGEPDENASFFTDMPPAITVVAGRSYTVTAELVDNAGASLSPAVTATVMFSVATYAGAMDIATLRAGTEGDYYQLTGEAILTYNAGNSRNQRYIEDGTGAILIDDSVGTITTSYNVGDGITGINGQLSSFSGVLQFVPTVDPGTASTTGNTITPQVVTIAQLNANLNDYESEWITIQDVTFVDGDGSATFAASTNYDINDAVPNTLVFRTNFSTSDFIGDLIPTAFVNITGLASEFNGTSQIFGTAAANIVLGVDRDQIEGFSVYPNPVSGNNLSITTSSTDSKSVSIFNVLGRQVFSQKFSSTNKTFDVSGIASGVYILKVTEGNRTATKKLIIE